MRRLILAAGITLAVAPAALAAPARPTPHTNPVRHGHRCAKLYTVPMGMRAARAVYAGTRTVPRHERQMLGRIARCQRNPRATKFVGHYAVDQRQAWLDRQAEASVTPYGEWAIPGYIVMCESGGENLPPNSASASGYYQILASTWKSYGGDTEAAYLASKYEQDVIAGRIWRAYGTEQWVCG